MKSAVCLLIPLLGMFPPSPLSGAPVYLSVSRRHNQELWGLPGGKVDPGESNLKALVREIYEEIGLELRPEDLEPIYSNICVGDVSFWVTTYLLRRGAGPLRKRPVLEEGLALNWCTEAQLTDPATSPFAEYNVGVFEAFRRYRDAS